jgi:hypothetical protein
MLRHISTGTAPVKDVSGRQLARRLKRGLSAAFRALLAHEMQAGAVCIHHLSRRQAVALTSASWGYVSTIAKMTPDEREQLGDGRLSLSAVHNRAPTDADVDRIVAKLGAERVLAALDRATAPTTITTTNNDIHADETPPRMPIAANENDELAGQTSLAF